MLKLIGRYGANKERVICEYASAEEKDEVERKSNSHNWTARQYARALWRDGVRRGWVNEVR